MALKGKAKIIQSPHAKTQYLTIPSAITRDSQYPFKNGDEVEIIIDPRHKMITITGEGSSIEIVGDKIQIGGKKRHR